MTSVSLRVYTAGGTVVSVAPDFIKATIQEAHNDVGAGSIDYPRDGKNAGLLAVGTDDVVVAILIEGIERGRILVEDDSWDESEDKPTVTIAGRGLGALLEAAIVYPSGGAGAVPASWVFTATSPGGIFRTLVQEAQARGALAGLTLGAFTSAVDSSGTTWPTTLNVTYEAGADLLAVLTGLAEGGLVDWRVNGGTLDLYVPDTTLGVDRPGVRFQRGRDLLAAPRQKTRRELATALLVAGDGGVTVERTDAPSIATYGRKERYVTQGGVADTGTLSAVGDLHLSTRKVPRLAKTHALAVDAEGCPQPWVDFRAGDYVRTNTSGLLETYRVKQLAVDIDNTGRMAATLALNDSFAEADVLNARRLKALTGGSLTVGVSTAEPTPAGPDVLAPAAPTALNVTSLAYVDSDGNTQAQLTATWTAPTTNSDGTALTDLDGYEAEWRYGTETVFRPLGFTTAAIVSWSPVTPGASVVVRVRAVDRTGNRGAMSSTFTGTAASDVTPPPVPSTPIVDVTTFLQTARVTWNGLTSTGANMVTAAPDFARVEVHASTTSGFTPSTATRLETIDSPIGQTVALSLPIGAAYFIRFVSVDQVGNVSAASTQVAATVRAIGASDVAALAIGDAQIGSVSVGKLVAGSLTADVTLSAMIKTGTSGARVEIDGAGVRLYNSSGVVAVNLNASTGAGTFTGVVNIAGASTLSSSLSVTGSIIGSGVIQGPTFQTAGSGKRIVITGASDQITLYSGNANEVNPGLLQITDSGTYTTASINSPRLTSGDFAYIQLRSSQYAGSDSLMTLHAQTAAFSGAVTGQSFTGFIYDNGYRVYSPANPDPNNGYGYGSNPYFSTCQVNNVTIGQNYNLWHGGDDGLSTVLACDNGGYIQLTNTAYTIWAGVKGGAYTNASSEKIKKNIRDLTYGLDTIMKLRPVHYHLKAAHADGNGDKGRIGFIAEEVRDHLPDVVHQSGTGHAMDIPGIDFGAMTSAVVAAIQELNNKVDALSARVA